MVFDDDLKEVSIFFGPYSQVHVVSNLFGLSHGLLKLKLGDFFFQ